MAELRALMLAPAPVLRIGDRIFLDAKFIDGMRLHNALWPGRFACLLREGAQEIPFGAQDYDPENAGFDLIVLGRDEPLTRTQLDGYDLIMSSADDPRNFALPDLSAGLAARHVSTLEYTFDTRLRIALLETGRSLPRRIYAAVRLWRDEVRRRAYLRRMDGLQANGYPAQKMCRKIDPETLFYLDNRMTPDLYATAGDMADAAARLRAGHPLRLVFTGRLNTMKGAHDLVSFARALQDRGVAFRLDIYGTGSLQEAMARDIPRQNLTDCVALHEPLDFDTALVPQLRASCDLFICCHKQADPSCTYIESMGCGLAIAGYDNAMWDALCADSGGGWTTPLGKPGDLAAEVARLDQNREEIIARRDAALDFARQHDFRTGFANRMAHLRRVAENAGG